MKRNRIAESKDLNGLIEHCTWLGKMLLAGHFSAVAVHILEPRLIRLLPDIARDWLYARWEWSVCREFNDGPDECYLPWKEFWKQAREVASND